MAWTEYFTVRSSTVYENKGLAKALFSLIAMMIERADEGEKPTENEGWCFASERYLAESLGMSDNRVYLTIRNLFLKDGWLVKESVPAANGGSRNRYRLADNAMGRLGKLKRERGAKRPKNPNKIRKDSIEKMMGRSAAQLPPSSGVKTTVSTLSRDASLLGVGMRPYSEPPRVPTPSSKRSRGRSSVESSGEENASSPALQGQINPTPDKPDFRQGAALPSTPALTGHHKPKPLQREHFASCQEELGCVGDCMCWCHQDGPVSAAREAAAQYSC